MKALTLTQPWATLIALGAKTFETRGWSTNYRGPLAIHAAKGLGGFKAYPDERVTAAELRRRFVSLCGEEPFASVLTGARLVPADLPLGAVVAIGWVSQCAPTESVRKYLRNNGRLDEISFGDYSDGRYAFELVDVGALPRPVPATGALGLWDLPESLIPIGAAA